MSAAFFPVAGQGVFLFSTKAPCTIRLTTVDGASGLAVEFDDTSVLVNELPSGKPLADPKNNRGLSTHAGAYYWVSLDAQNQRIQAGIGEARPETAIYTYSFPAPDKETHAATKAFLESITRVSFPATVQAMKTMKDPILRKVPMEVKAMDDLTMADIASGAALPVANLPAVSQKLYSCIAGKNFKLNTHDFPDFTQAIEYSIRTPGLWCYQKLRDKSREFNPDVPDLSETYLRITLGENNGESPGVPYVMEIWPVGHYSPIHSHAAADAVIRVLNGEIRVSLYPFLCAEKDGVEPFTKATFKEGDVTWITPALNQVHQLKNMETNSETCITIQCYMYPGRDRIHYDYFDYLDADGKEQQYEPDSDMDFLAFKELIRKEWAARPQSVKGSAWSVMMRDCFGGVQCK